MTVIVEENDDWWMGDVVFVEGGARNTKVPPLFQVANVDTGVIRWINADLVTHIVPRIHEPVAAQLSPYRGFGTRQRGGD